MGANKKSLGLLAVAVAFFTVLASFVGLHANDRDFVAMHSEHGGEIGRALARDGIRYQPSDTGIGVWVNNDTQYTPGYVIPVLKNTNTTFVINTTTHGISPVIQIEIFWGDGEAVSPPETPSNPYIHAYSENGTYQMTIIQYHEDGYKEYWNYTIISFDGFFSIPVKPHDLSEDILNYTWVYLYTENFTTHIAKHMNGDEIGELRPAELNLMQNNIIKTHITNIATPAIDTYQATFYYINSTEFFAFVYSPAVVSDVINFTLGDVGAGNVVLNLYPRNMTLKMINRFEANFTEDFNSLKFKPSITDLEGGAALKILWDNFATFLGAGSLDGVLNYTEARAVIDNLTTTFLYNLTGEDIVPLTLGDNLVVDSTAIYNYVDNSIRGGDIFGYGDYVGENAINNFTYGFEATYHTNAHINRSVDQHIVKVRIVPDTPYWDRKIVIHFTGWNITHVEATQTRATINDANVTYTNDTVYIDPTENSYGNLTIYLYREISPNATSSGAVATYESEPWYQAIWDWILAHPLLIATTVLVIGLIVYAAKDTRPRRRR